MKIGEHGKVGKIKFLVYLTVEIFTIAIFLPLQRFSSSRRDFGVLYSVTKFRHQLGSFSFADPWIIPNTLLFHIQIISIFQVMQVLLS